MIISTKGRYGVHAIFVLALKYNQGPQSIKNIAKEQSISETYLEQIFSCLRKADLIKSIRGVNGGYVLAKPPEEITVGSVMESLEGPLTPADCVLETCNSSHDCATHAIWCRIYEGIHEVVYSITLKDMVDDFNKKNISLEQTRCK